MKRIYSIQCSLNANDPVTFKWQNKKSKYIAAAWDNAVNIYNRHGEHVDQVNLFGFCVDLAWDAEGDLLAIITDRSPLIFLWNASTHRLQQVDSGIKESLHILLWSITSAQPLLCVATVKGAVLLYNHQTSRKITVPGKHHRKIVSGAWSSANLLALAGEDKVLTVSNEQGETVCINSLKGEPSLVQFLHSYFEETRPVSHQSSAGNNPMLSSSISAASASSEPNCVSCVLNRRLLYVVNLEDSENPYLITFQDWYGSIVNYHCYPNGNLFIAFNSGLVVTVSTCYKNFGSELMQIKAHKDLLGTLSICPAAERVATCSENNIKIFALYDHNDIEHVLTIDDEPAIDLIEWTSDGQLLATASASGTIHVYLSQLKILGDKYGTSLAFLSSLLEVTVFNVHEDVQDSVMIVRVEIEPSHIAIGPFHLAVAMNNRLWLYSLTAGAAAVAEAADPQNQQQQQQQQLNLLVGEHEYVGIVKTVKMNAHYIAVQFTNGSLQLHAIENSGTGGGDSTGHQEHIYHYPDGAEMTASAKSNNNGVGGGKSSTSVTSIALTADFLIFSVASGQVHYFILEDWAAVVVYRHHPPGVGISLLEANLNGTRLILQDDRGDVFILNVYGEQVVAMAPEHVPTTTNRSGGGGGAPLKALWESWIADRAVFTLSDGKFIYVYAAVRATVEGGKVEYVGKMKIPGGQFPLLLYNGVIVCQTKSGKTSNFILSTHDYSIKATASEAAQREVFRSILKLRRWADAMKICSYLNDAGGGVGTFWKELGEAALYDLQVDVAIRVYSHLKQYGLVHSLQQYKREEEQSLFAGYLAELLGRFDLAQRHFLASSKPLCALQMRKNLLHWDEALALARHLAPTETPAICRQLAQHQEYGAQYRAALENFESALQNFSENTSTSSSKHILLCQGGIARNAIRCGDVKRGLQVLSTTSLDPVRDVDVFTECASILQQLKHHQEAAGLYERVGQFNTAASLYLKAKNTAKLNSLLPNIDDPEILTELARSKEADRAFRPALDIYAKAGQWLDVVRLHLDHLNSPGEAVKVVRERRSVEGAKLIAKYFQRRGDTTTAIEFLVLSKCTDDAYNLAKTTNAMDTYADILEDLGDRNAPASAADFRTIAIYYEQQQQDGGSSKGQQLLKAGKFYVLAKLYKKGVKLLLQAAAAASASPEEEADALELAIEAAAAARDEQITRLVLDFLMGESDIGNGGNGGNGSNGGGGVGDGLPKDFKYLFKLYMKMEYYKEAAKTAVIISREEQAQGNYRNAHQLLFGMCSELRRHGIAIPPEMTDGLLLVHSYMLAKLWIRAGNHKNSVKLLLRVGDNIGQFPAHATQILTTLVIECQRAGYPKTALKYAQLLMKPENREKVDAKFRRKIETLVRKSAGVVVTPEELAKEVAPQATPCPHCSSPVAEDRFTCFSCNGQLPFCLASGMHVLREDLTQCPACRFPAIMSALLSLLSVEATCPLCSSAIDVAQVKSVLALSDLYR